jgi:predicted dehydrogenase
MRKVRFALIGAGQLARNQHLPNLMRSEYVELAAVCDRSEEVREIVKKEFNPSCPIISDHHEVLNDPSIEAVVIATREDTHVPLTLEALAAGKHVYVEKPLAETADDCRKATEAQQKAGKIVAVGMNRRLAPAYQKAKALLDANGGAKNLYYRMADEYAITWGKQYPGQRIFHELCHIFDVLRFFTESDVVSVYCASGRVDEEQVILRFRSGATAGIMSSGYVWRDLPKEHLEAIAEKGALTVEDFVTLRQFALAEKEPPVQHFAGHVHIKADTSFFFELFHSFHFIYPFSFLVAKDIMNTSLAMWCSGGQPALLALQRCKAFYIREISLYLIL